MDRQYGKIVDGWRGQPAELLRNLQLWKSADGEPVVRGENCVGQAGNRNCGDDRQNLWSRAGPGVAVPAWIQIIRGGVVLYGPSGLEGRDWSSDPDRGQFSRERSTLRRPAGHG